jgi:hypothetical protein
MNLQADMEIFDVSKLMYFVRYYKNQLEFERMFMQAHRDLQQSLTKLEDQLIVDIVADTVMKQHKEFKLNALSFMSMRCYKTDKLYEFLNTLREGDYEINKR